MELYLSIISIIISIIALITPFVLYKKQKNDNKLLDLEVRLFMSTIGAGPEYRYEYIIINHSQKTTYVREVYLEFYKYDDFDYSVKYKGQPSAGETIPPYSSITDFIGEEDKFKEIWCIYCDYNLYSGIRRDKIKLF